MLARSTRGRRLERVLILAPPHARRPAPGMALATSISTLSFAAPLAARSPAPGHAAVAHSGRASAAMSPPGAAGLGLAPWPSRADAIRAASRGARSGFRAQASMRIQAALSPRNPSMKRDRQPQFEAAMVESCRGPGARCRLLRQPSRRCSRRSIAWRLSSASSTPGSRLDVSSHSGCWSCLFRSLPAPSGAPR